MYVITLLLVALVAAHAVPLIEVSPLLWHQAVSKAVRTPYDPDEYEVVTNDNGYVVGRVLGDGASVTLPVNFTDTLEICLNLNPGIPVDPDSLYPVLDFASFNATGDSRFIPLELAVTEVAGTPTKYCADIDVSGSYFPIRRMANWQNFTTTTAAPTTTTTPTVTTTTTAPPTTTPAPSGLSTAAIAIIVVGSVLFCIVLIVVVVFIITTKMPHGSKRYKKTKASLMQYAY